MSTMHTTFSDRLVTLQKQLCDDLEDAEVYLRLGGEVILK